MPPLTHEERKSAHPGHRVSTARVPRRIIKRSNRAIKTEQAVIEVDDGHSSVVFALDDIPVEANVKAESVHESAEKEAVRAPSVAEQPYPRVSSWREEQEREASAGANAPNKEQPQREERRTRKRNKVVCIDESNELNPEEVLEVGHSVDAFKPPSRKSRRRLRREAAEKEEKVF